MKTVRINLHYLTYFALTDDKRFLWHFIRFFNFHVLKLSNVFTRETLARLLAMALCLCLSQVRVLWKRMNEFSWFLAWELPSTYPVLYFSLAVLDPRVSHAMDALFHLSLSSVILIDSSTGSLVHLSYTVLKENSRISKIRVLPSGTRRRWTKLTIPPTVDH